MPYYIAITTNIALVKKISPFGNTIPSSSSVKSINLTNIPAPRQLLQKNYLIRFSDFQIMNHFAQQMGTRKDATVSQKTRMTYTLAIFGEKSRTFDWHRINTSIRGQVWQSVLDGSESLNPRSIPAGLKNDVNSMRSVERKYEESLRTHIFLRVA